jgi:hypothetical protein
MADNGDPFDLGPLTDDDDPPARDAQGRLTREARTYMEENKAVLFVDLLGFSRLTLKWPVLRNEFWLMDRPNREDFLRARLESMGENKLIESYMHFNMAIDDAIEWALLAHSDELKAIAFSDSAFIATDRVYDAIDIAQHIWSRLIEQHIPVRFGIAYGSFLVMRFRSDISLRAETHAAQFAGKAVVWAHAACEQSGLKGFRLFVHPSAAEVLGDPKVGLSEYKQFKTVIELGEAECSEHVASEVMLLNKTHEKLKDILDRQWWRHVQAMHQAAIEDDAPAGAVAHYFATFDALNRMRERFDRPPLHPFDQFPLERKPALDELFTRRPKPSHAAADGAGAGSS